ncbi:MAG TPA: OmpH family outer membrane protein [Balneolaceae bacterium]|nr:OmpH family outer membrane protein [Balneolaceae bacterium]
MKKLQLILFALLFPVAAQAQLSVGVMSPDQVLDALPQTTQIETELQEYVQSREQAFQAQYQAWIEEVTAYSEAVEAGEYTEQQQQQEEARLAEQEEELTSFQTRIQNQIQQRQNELFTPLLARVEQAMQDVSEEMGLSYVLNKQSGSGDPIVYYVSDRGVDITERVIQYLTQN